MAKVKIIQKRLLGFNGEAWLVKKGKKYFVVSGTSVISSGWEVLVFPATKDGEVTDWMQVCGGRDITHEEAINKLEVI